jgi:hypothetical protein
LKFIGLFFDIPCGSVVLWKIEGDDKTDYGESLDKKDMIFLHFIGHAKKSKL